MPSKVQIKHEEFAAKCLVALVGEPATYLRLGVAADKEPDVLFAKTNGALGVEVTDAFYKGDGSEPPNERARAESQFARNPTFDQPWRA
jgi:hypothetical protein